ncbi:nucleotide-binding protein [Candidatus Woesearchaeota archaeon]|nr:nucleotide-binding protein [Candidatus Woesearchaeota archaeon]MDP6648141.1 nucleotide-binding protein [Candidatus Woesearchaeota archaeon]
MKKIILDTNFLLIPMQFKVDIFSEFNRICNFNYKLFVFESSINELKKIISNQKGKNKKAAQIALKLIKSKNIGMIRSDEQYVDSLILENLDKDTIIATQDMELKNKVLDKGSSVIILRQKKYLKLVERKLYK